MSIEIASNILGFWFKDISFTDAIPYEKMAHWWQKDSAFDALVKDKFEVFLKNASAGQYDNWRQLPDGSLALIILFDQFTRNMYRNTSDSYAFDDVALDIASKGVALKYDCQLVPIQRAFFYMPFEHAEDRQMQEQSVELFAKLLADAPEVQKPIFEQLLEYAKQHKVVIDKFGRYPHRNKILGRTSTVEEIEYLKHNKGF